MRTLTVSLERNGVLVPVGTISGNNTEDASFCYSDEYLHDPQSAAPSISLPLREQPYSPSQTAYFFEGLLPEGFTRRSVAQWMHVDDGDYLSLLHGLGRECLGANALGKAENQSGEKHPKQLTLLHSNDMHGDFLAEEIDYKLAAVLDPAWGIDLIIGGHSHTLLDESCVVNGIPIVLHLA